MPAATIIAVLGAECTGKSTLVQALGLALGSAGVDVVVVPELLRAFCAEHGRPPRVDEQALLAHAQSDRIATAAERHAVVVADTTALMTAVYSDLYFDDRHLYAASLSQQRNVHLTLLAGLDLPWRADGIQRDGPAMRAKVDAQLRAVLREQDIPFSVIYGQGNVREQAALSAVWRCLRPPRAAPDAPPWRWVCQHCGDGACEAAALAR